LDCPKCHKPITVVQPPSEVAAASPPPEKNNRIPVATQKQKDYARSLGIEFQEDIDRRTISKLIDEAQQKETEDRFKQLDELQDRESEAYRRMRAEIEEEVDEEDPRLSRASEDEIMEALSIQGKAAILITLAPDAVEAIMNGSRVDTASLSYTDDSLELEDVNEILGRLRAKTPT
jgi:hypothetical protein